MILGDGKTTRPFQLPDKTPVIIFLLLFLLIAAALIVRRGHRGPSATAATGILLDAERNFPGVDAHFISDEAAHTGSHSYKIPAGDGPQYGPAYDLEPVQPGEVYRITVWRQRNSLNEGKLVVNASGGGSFYLETADKTGADEAAWEKLELYFHIPFETPPQSLKVYIYTNGYLPVYFDDLRIEKVDVWQKSRFQPVAIGLEIGAKALQKLEEKRQQALREGILVTADDDWVNARLTDTSGQEIPVEIRLKGDWLDHLNSRKWSFRVRVRDPYSWRGLKTFSLHTPAARYFLHEWLLHQLWEREDVLTTRYDFVELRLNGQSLGIYAFEEHFEKQLIESRKRREGPILKFSETGMWTAIQRQLEGPGYTRPGATHSAMDADNAPVEVFREGPTLADSTLAGEWREALHALEAFRTGEAPPAQIFDLDRLARYYAVADALNAYHGIAWHNQRFYYNPITGLLEPIGFDGYGEQPPRQYDILGQGGLNPFSLDQNSLFSGLAQDSAFMAAYVRELDRITSPRYFPGFIDSVREEWTPRLEWLQMETPDYKPDLTGFEADAAYVHSLLLPYPGESLRAYIQTSKNGLQQVAVSNRHTLPVRVVGFGKSAKTMTIPLDEPVLLPGVTPRRFRMKLKRDSLIRDFASLRFQEEAAMQQGPPTYRFLEVGGQADFLFFQPLGLDTLMSAPLIPSALPEGLAAAPATFARAELKRNGPYLVNGRQIDFPPGDHAIREDIVIPAGYAVRFAAGSRLNLLNGAAFISRSPVEMAGEPDNPVEVRSDDGTGNGFTVLEAKTASVLQHVVFDNLTTLRRRDWQLTGAVTFYASAVKLSDCTFRKNHCEDALNIVRSEFDMESCHFSDTAGDGFDTDFCRGEIRRSAFVHTGNDGMDFSGSVIVVRNCLLESNGDKGISVGEESDVHVFDTEFAHDPIAIASKDLSMAYVSNVTLSDCDQGFAAYRKKPEFGGADLIVESYKATGIRRLYQAAEGSRIIFKQEK
ncbi:MAG: CotH kinase family protein [Lewinellaceae bacterium]|nr:CotH kinase family protein [Lewinellaceae bacterium]